MKPIQHTPLNVLLADDDGDDHAFFKNALTQIPLFTHLHFVQDGEQLMHYLLDSTHSLPDVLFLDINMPRKNGFECLEEIKLHKELKHLPIIIMSTSVEPDVISRLYNNGAQYFIRKPAEFSQFKKLILQTLTLVQKGVIPQPTRENFILIFPDVITT